MTRQNWERNSAIRGIDSRQGMKERNCSFNRTYRRCRTSAFAVNYVISYNHSLHEAIRNKLIESSHRSDVQWVIVNRKRKRYKLLQF